MKKASKFLSGILAVGVTLMPLFVGCGLFPDKPVEGEKKPTRRVYYSEFGAKGDGKTDDFDAIVKAHEYANEHNLPVSADEGAHYYIGAHQKTAIVRTDTDWGDAEFTVDDREVSKENKGYNIFEIRSDYDAYRVELPEGYALTEGQKNIGLTFSSPVLLEIVNANKKDYIRYGNNQNNGSSRQEIVLVDEQGNVDKDTPILWRYDTVTSMTAHSVSDEGITVEGGRFTTIVNRETVNSGYYARGINVKRSNTTLSCIAHYLDGEPTAEADPPETPTPGKSSAPYTGFYVVNTANNVTIESCVLTGHASYRYRKPTGWVTQGTYDTQAARSNRVSWIDCTQSNDITDKTYWGIMASNFCKNLTMDGCKLSRFDAHQGVYNATIRNSELGQTLNVIGAGTLLVENVTRYGGGHFLQLRTDYGSSWDGEAIFKNCTLDTTDFSCAVISASWTDWNFGYPCYLPFSVTLDNFKVTNPSAKCYVYSSITTTPYEKVLSSKNPYSVTQTVNVPNEATPVFLSMNKSGLFERTALNKVG